MRDTRGYLALGLVAAMFATGCCSNPKVWSFKLSCATHAAFGGDMMDYAGAKNARTPVNQEQHMDQLATSLAVIVVMFVPLSIDLILLPVTGIHDLFFSGD